MRAVEESLPLGYPIREPAGQRMCAPLRSFSQLAAPFFAILLLRHPPWTYVSLDHIASAPGTHSRTLSLFLQAFRFPCSLRRSPSLCFPSLVISNISSTFHHWLCNKVGQNRVELLTPALSERCSNQLSYCPKLLLNSRGKERRTSTMKNTCYVHY